jgi:hypothetical protein
MGLRRRDHRDGVVARFRRHQVQQRVVGILLDEDANHRTVSMLPRHRHTAPQSLVFKGIERAGVTTPLLWPNLGERLENPEDYLCVDCGS